MTKADRLKRLRYIGDTERDVFGDRGTQTTIGVLHSWEGTRLWFGYDGLVFMSFGGPRPRESQRRMGFS